jgi:hypothetical protein
MEEENLRLKERVKELEETLMPPPILATPVAMIQPDITLQGTPESNMRVKGISSLIIATRHFVEKNIKKRMSLILDLWDLEKKNSSLGLRIQNTKEYLNAYLKNDEGFFTDGVAMFVEKVSAMTDHRRKQEYFPSQSHMKQLKACWIERINTLKGLLNQLKELSRKKTEAYSKIIGLDIAGSTIEVSDPNLISNSMIMSREQFEEQVENLKKSSAKKFDSMVEYTYDDIDNWLVEYTNKNEDIETILQNLSIDHREIESELLSIKVKQEVIVSPLREYIQEWLNKAITKIVEFPTEAVTTGHITATGKDIKGASTSK